MNKHLKERMKERYNIELCASEARELLNKIRLGDSTFLYDAVGYNGKRKFCYVMFKKIPVKVLYERSKKGVNKIITVYPFDVDEYNDMTQKTYQNCLNGAIAFLKQNGYIVYKRKES